MRIVAVDTGGTFTDLVSLGGGGLERLKVPSTPHDPAQAVLDGVRALVPVGEPFHLIHGSTVATNALLERKGSRVHLVTNRGFEDVIEIGRQNRPQLYALVGHRLPPLVAREDRVGVRGRLGPDGTELEPLDPAELTALPERLAGAVSVAVVLLHAYADPAHEERVAAALADLGVPLSVSSRILPEYREYERTSTTVVNAYVGPLMDRYLGRLDREAGARRFRVMGSNGGALSAERARAEPVHTVLSGPAGGVVGALAWGERTGLDRLITFDMGGTSTDVSLCPGRPLHTREFQIDGQPVAVPVIDIHTVGAGGGSLARVDPGGALRVGPESAGAVPGPICYGRGGTQVTVTDANVWLGRLPADAFLGDRELDREAVRAPLTALAQALGSTPERAAEGVLAVAETAMVRALRVISVERGFDPADFTLVAFGGAGGLHAAELARALGAASVLVPPDPGLLSAFGMLVAPVSRTAVRTLLAHTGQDGLEDRVRDALAETDAEARALLSGESDADESIEVERQVDARYRGQSFELRVPADDWLERFHAAHQARYGYERREAVVEVVTVRSDARASGPAAPFPTLPDVRDAAPLRPHPVYEGGAHAQGSRVERASLRAGHRLRGPLVITEYSGTVWVPSGWTVEVDASACLHLRAETDA
ncbi:MAG: hydantoinase/oxoprolinase family protein [Gemmatimonadetes bacterium]|nr:hydantoinase/oxoprolinase family protein [Gemmatimonadota bacterium]